jgi:acetyltransferase-like isoleucine patch superfamily enzyme
MHALRIAARIVDAIHNLWFPLYVRPFGVHMARGARVIGLPIFSLKGGGSIRIGRGVVLCSRSRETALGVAHPVVMRTLAPGAVIEIGEDTGISGGAICAQRSVRIGRNCLFGADVLVCDTDFHAIAPEGRRRQRDPARIGCAPVVIEDDVFLGTGAIVLKGVRVGAGAIVGAGAVVTRDVPARSIVAGNPARVVGSVDQSSGSALRPDAGIPAAPGVECRGRVEDLTPEKGQA